MTQDSANTVECQKCKEMKEALASVRDLATRMGKNGFNFLIYTALGDWIDRLLAEQESIQPKLS